MKTSENHNKKGLPPELEELLQDVPNEDIKGLEEVWALAGKPPSDGFPDARKIESVWDAIDSQIESQPEPSIRPVLGAPVPLRRAQDRPASSSVRPKRKVAYGWGGLVAAVVVAAIAFGYWFTPVSVMAPYGETIPVSLADGSSVMLNSGSSLTYARRFASERRIQLEGEAYFDVVKDEKPFVVETFNSSVRVLGTRFNVRAWQQGEDAKTKVALQSGSVQLVDRSGKNDPVTLSPGQTADVDDETITLNEADNERLESWMAWRSGAFVFSDDTVDFIVEEIERRYDIQITLRPASLGEKRIKYTQYDSVEAEAIIQDLSEFLGVQFNPMEGGFELFED